MGAVCFVLLITCRALSWPVGVEHLVDSGSGPLRREMRRSMLDSPDHCEHTPEKRMKLRSRENDAPRTKESNTATKSVDADAEGNKEINDTRVTNANIERDKKGSSQEDVKNNKEIHMSTEDLQTTPKPNKTASKGQDEWAPRMKKIIVRGKPRKVKIVAIIPVPVDDNGNAWN